MALSGLGLLIFPLLYAFTPLLSFADYRLPDTAGIAGVIIFAAALLLFWRSHVDLGENWSPVMTVAGGQRLVTAGVYGHIRHPMYLAHLLWALALPLILWNGVAGWTMLVALVLRRMPREEAMMLDHFGEDYGAYMARTGRLVPRLWRR
ncbi:protein-S-isoprenylcysteine O-methyltransferase [Methanofollis sp. UBA420]|jgi:protein-S-isoprenylcysteine O-methyltransferase Ste14|uniref:protein-S-isoprenylcysteine O-methyltransferase n=1 Tax=Methanofollis sp. UBA420 TaxID=1915514 RepID=UPI00316AE442